MFKELFFVFINPSIEGQFLSGVLTGFNSKISFSQTGCATKVKEPSLPYYSTIVGERTVRCIPFLRVLVQCKKQAAASRI